jgi:hypothetical protein
MRSENNVESNVARSCRDDHRRVATRFQLLPDVIDVTWVFTAAGGVGILATIIGASLQFPAERVARMTLFGQLVGFVGGAILLVVGLLAR